MAITFFGVASVPTDPGTNTTDPTAFSNPPVASMQEGDLCIVFAYCRTASATINVSNSGGQDWSRIDDSGSTFATLTASAFWCRFNGTWSAAPSFSFGATTNNSVVMLVFRPTSTSYYWALDPATLSIFTDQAAATTYTADWGSSTPDNNSNVSISSFFTQDDNTWGTLTGTGWSKTGLSAQYRNTSGQDTSSTHAYLIQTTAASRANCAQTQLTLGGDAGTLFQGAFYEYDVSPFSAMYRNIEQPYFQKPTIIIGQTKGLKPDK